jgi:serine O-acetyltransferase
MLEDHLEWSNDRPRRHPGYYDRDPACDRFLMPVLYFKGYHAIQTHRLAHWLWNLGRKDFASTCRAGRRSVFQMDINPMPPASARAFSSTMATGIVVGETAVIEDNVSILQGVTLGGTGKEAGDRHPKIRHGVLIGAGAKILGNIEVGHCSRRSRRLGRACARSANKTVAGVPARVVGETGCDQPSRARWTNMLPSQIVDNIATYDI